MKDEITLKEVRDSGMKKWGYLMENGKVAVLKDIPFYSEIVEYHAYCSACQYVADKHGGCFNFDNCGDDCPLFDSIGQCAKSSGNLFAKWANADDAIDRAFYAKKIYEAHEAIEVEEDVVIQVGDTVKQGGHSGLQGVLEYINNGTGKRASYQQAYVRSDSYEVAQQTNLNGLIFVSRPEKPVEHVINNVTWSTTGFRGATGWVPHDTERPISGLFGDIVREDSEGWTVTLKKEDTNE